MLKLSLITGVFLISILRLSRKHVFRFQKISEWKDGERVFQSIASSNTISILYEFLIFNREWKAFHVLFASCLSFFSFFFALYHHSRAITFNKTRCDLNLWWNQNLNRMQRKNFFFWNCRKSDLQMKILFFPSLTLWLLTRDKNEKLIYILDCAQMVHEAK